MTKESDVKAEVRLGETTVTIGRGHNPLAWETYNILGREALSGGKVKVWIDSLVHAPHETSLGGVNVSGAVVSELVFG